MKTSLRKLQKFAALRHDRRGQKHQQSLNSDELARATKDMYDLRYCYDKLLSAAAATANSVYESLWEMGDCLLEKTTLDDDEESGKVLLMMGKVQFELQKLVDAYRAHIFQTIIVPSESILNELHVVEEMKKRCDGKREIYDDLMKKQKEKGKLRSSKGECFPAHQVQAARDDFEEEINIFVFRMKSLKQGKCRTLLTQAFRHHSAQLCFFKKALSCLEVIDPQVRLVAEERHIDYQFRELKEDIGGTDDDGGDDDESDGDDDSELHDEGDLSFDYGQAGPALEASTRSSMLLDDTNALLSSDPKLGVEKESLSSPAQNSFSFGRQVREISKSAPLFPEKKLDSTERLAQMRPLPSQRFTSYVLPTPDETKSVTSVKVENEVPQTRPAAQNLWHSSPLDKNKYEKIKATGKFSGPIILDTQSVLKENNKSTRANQSPPPRSEDHSFKRFDPSGASYAKKVKTHAFSGPLASNPWPNNPSFSSSGPISTSGFPPFSGPLLRTPLSQPSSTPKLSANLSPTFTSSPVISELHELPRPPDHLAARRPSNRSAHSGPLMPKSYELSTSRLSTTSTTVSTLPLPPAELPRSFSIPAGHPTEVTLRLPLEILQKPKTLEDTSSLSVIAKPNI